MRDAYDAADAYDDAAVVDNAIVEAYERKRMSV